MFDVSNTGIPQSQKNLKKPEDLYFFLNIEYLIIFKDFLE